MSSVMPPLDLHDDAFAPVPPADQQVAQLRVPPHSMESESSVLGGLLLDNNAWERVGDLLSESDFYRHEHKLIYDAIGKLVNASKPADVITVYEQLQSIGKAEGNRRLDVSEPAGAICTQCQQYSSLCGNRA